MKKISLKLAFLLLALLIMLFFVACPAPTTFTITIDPTPQNGTIVLNPSDGPYDADTEVTVTAEPETGYRFSAWGGDLSGSTNPTTLTMTKNYTITATFVESVSYQLTVNANAGGSIITPATSPISVESGIATDIEAQADTGYVFAEWTTIDTGVSFDDVYASSTTVTLTEGDATITANFIQDTTTYTLNITNDSNGSVIINPNNTEYIPGSQVLLTPVPNQNYGFDNWGGIDAGDLVNNGNGTYSITMDSDKTLEANFITYTLTVSDDTNGSVIIIPYKTSYVPGDIVTLTPQANNSYEFDNWTGTNASDVTSNNDGSYSITMNGNKSILANFLEYSWVKIGGPAKCDITVYESYLSLTFDITNKPYVSYRGIAPSAKVAVMSYDETNGWSGDYNVSDGQSWWTSLEFDSLNNPYVLYRDGANYAKASVKKFNGSSWEYYGNPGFSPGAGDYAKLAFDSMDKLYFVYRNSYADFAAQVMSFDGSDWLSVGSAGISQSYADWTTIDIDSDDNVYIVYQDEANGDGATVLKFNGTNWIGLGQGGFSDGMVAYTDIALNNNDIPYVIYQDQANSNKATVMMYDGVEWLAVGPVGFSDGEVEFTTIAFDSNNILYVAYKDSAHSNYSVVKKFDGINWVDVGTTGFSGQDASWIELKIDGNDIPYVAYQTTNGNIMVERYVQTVATKTYTLTTNTSGNGSISIDPPTGPYTAGTYVEITVTPNTNNTFNNWTGANAIDMLEEVSGSIYSIYINGDKDITANFVADTITYTLTGNDDGNGYVDISFGGPYYPGDVEVVEPIANLDYKFSYWSGDNAGDLINNNNGTYSIVMDSNKTITANFIQTYTLTANSSGNGSISIFPSSGPYESGSTVILTPAANSGYTFNNWTGTNAGDVVDKNNGTYTILMNGNKSITANFIAAYSLTVTNDGNGNVTLNPAGGSYVSGTSVTLTPAANSGYLFEYWDGANAGDVVDNGDGSFTITMNANKSVKANFVLDWIELGGPSNSAGWVDLKFSKTNVPYVAYKDSTNTKAAVMSYDSVAKTWSGYNNISSAEAWWTSIDFDSSNTPYVIYRDNTQPNNRATMRKLVSANWVNVGSEGFTYGAGDNAKVVINSADVPYIAYRNSSNGYKAHSMRYNGSSWVSIGNTTGFSELNADWIDLALDNTSIPYVAFNDTNQSNKATVMKFDGTNWVNVGLAGFSAGVAEYISLALDSSNFPYIAYKDGGNGGKVTVMKFNDVAWVNVGSAGFSADVADYVSLAIDGEGTPYVAYKDVANNNKIVVMKYNGSSWVKLGPLGFSDDSVDWVDIEISNNGVPYVAYQMNGNIMVEKFSKQTSTTYTLTVTNNGNGSVTLNPAGGVYEAGRSIMLTPVPNSGNTFDGWTGSDGGDVFDNGNGTYTIVMTGNLSIQANFVSAGPPAMPVFTPSAGDHGTLPQIEITCPTAGALIRYTLDGSSPSSTNGILYTEPVDPAGYFITSSGDNYQKFNLYLRAVAYNGAGTSDMNFGHFTITPDRQNVYEVLSNYDNRVTTKDSNGFYHLAFQNRANWSLTYLTNKTGSWVSEQLTDVSGEEAPFGIVVDNSGYVHIGYGATGSGGSLNYITNKTGSWVSTSIETSGLIANGDIILDSSNNIHIVYIRDSNARYATNSSGSWQTELVNSETVGYYSYISMEIDSTNQIYMSYGNQDMEIKLIKGFSGNWGTSELVTTTEYTNRVSVSDIILDSNNKVYIFYTGDSYTVEIANNVSGDWVVETIDSYYRYSGFLAFDSQGYLHLTYTRYNYGPGGLYYATNRSGSWEKHLLNSPSWTYQSKAGGDPYLSIDSNDKIIILHGIYEGTNTNRSFFRECSWTW